MLVTEILFLHMLLSPGLPTDIYVSSTHHEYYQALTHHLNIEMNADFLVGANELMHLFLLQILPTALMFYDKKWIFKKMKMYCSRQ